MSSKGKKAALVLAILAALFYLALVSNRLRTGPEGGGVTSTNAPHTWAASQAVPASALIPALAVLPFMNISTDGSRQYLSQGITERLSAELESISSLRVTSPRSTMHYKGSEKSLREIAKELNVAMLLKGTVETTNDRLRISAQLVDVGENQLWAKTFDVSQNDLPSVQRLIVTDIASMNLVRPTAEELSRLTTRSKVSGEAYSEYLLGRYELSLRTENGFRAAIGHFQKAIAIDPNFASAYSGVADGYNLLANWGMLSPKESYSKAKIFVESAIRLDDSDGEAHASLAFIKGVYDWDRVGALREYQRAIELRPSYAAAHQWYALELAAMGRFGEAFQEIELARRLDPLTPIVQTHIGWVYYLAGNYDAAIRQYQLVLQATPEYTPARWRLGQAYIEKRMFTEAVTELRKSSADLHALALLGYVQALSGDTAEANRILAQLIKSSRTQYVPPVNMAIVCVGLGKSDEAFEWLQRATDDRCYWLNLLNVDPTFNAVRSDPRFRKLLNNVGL